MLGSRCVRGDALSGGLGLQLVPPAATIAPDVAHGALKESGMFIRSFSVFVLAVLAGGCDTLSKGPYAEAELKGSDGSRVWGRVTFHQPEGGTFLETSRWSAPVAGAAADSSVGKIYIRADVNGLPPGRQFGIHIHEKGDCSNNGMGAGGHFNPKGRPHGRHDAPEHHAGDLPNLSSDGEGVAMLAFTTEELTVSPGPNSVVGRAVVVHESPDDYRTQPAGNSGARIACGVIRAAN
jgi:Cu/Zn superoxide dismutase